MARMTQKDRELAAEAATQLRAWLPPGATVYCVLDGPVSRSGMSRTINLYGPEHEFLSGYAARVLGENRRANKDGITVGGCGMDMGFWLVSRLSHALYPEGFGCIGQKCPSNDHANGDRDYTPHGTVYALPNAANVVEASPPIIHWHKSGEYVLRHRWL